MWLVAPSSKYIVFTLVRLLLQVQVVKIKCDVVGRTIVQLPWLFNLLRNIGLRCQCCKLRWRIAALVGKVHAMIKIKCLVILIFHIFEKVIKLQKKVDDWQRTWSLAYLMVLKNFWIAFLAIESSLAVEKISSYCAIIALASA